jgi:single-strand DNA-binding protein
MIEMTVTGNVAKTTYAEPGGTPVLNFSIATNRRFVKNGESVEVTEWTSAEVWGPRASKLRQHISKGVKMLIRGRPQVSAFLRKDGSPGSSLALFVEDLEFLSHKPKAAA